MSTTSIEPQAAVKPVLDLSFVTHPLLRPIARLMPELSYYTLVSAAALGVDLAVFTALKQGGMRAATAGIVGYAVGLILHYLLSIRFVFDTSRAAKQGVRRFVEFVLSGVIGLGVTWLIIAVSTEWLHLPAMIGKIAAVGVAFIVVFLLRRGIVFAARKQ